MHLFKTRDLRTHLETRRPVSRFVQECTNLETGRRVSRFVRSSDTNDAYYRRVSRYARLGSGLDSHSNSGSVRVVNPRLSGPCDVPLAALAGWPSLDQLHARRLSGPCDVPLAALFAQGVALRVVGCVALILLRCEQQHKPPLCALRRRAARAPPRVPPSPAAATAASLTGGGGSGARATPTRLSMAACGVSLPGAWSDASGRFVDASGAPATEPTRARRAAPLY